MNWRNHAHLFANGKFRFKENNGREWELTPALSVVIGSHHRLVARPISDMSDEEQQEYDKNGIYSSLYHNGNKSEEDGYIDTPESFLYLLSIGVLPPIFDTTDVVWRYEND